MTGGLAVERARAQGWRLEGDEAVLEALAVHVLGDPAAALAQGRLLRRTAQRTVARVDLPGVGALLVKQERESGVEDTLRRLLRPSRARSEWEAAHWLQSRGLPVPAPRALAEQGGGLGVRTTLYACGFVEGSQPLLAWLAEAGPQEAAQVLEWAGALVRRMHDAGFDHRDLHAGNVLVAPGTPPGLLLIDLHRSRIASPSTRARHAALGRLLAFARTPVLAEPAVAGALLQGYAGAAGAVPALASAVRQGAEALRRARVAKHDREALCEGPWYTRMPAPWQGVHDRAFPAEQVAARVEDHDRLLASGGEGVLKDRPKSAVTRHGDVVVKETRVRGLRGLLKRGLVPWRLVAGHVHAHRLGLRGVATARSRACVRRDGRIFTLYDDLSALPRLDDEVRRLYAPGATRAPQVRLREASAAWLAGLHARGIYHGDVKSLHVLVDGTREGAAGPLRFVLIDTDRVRFLCGLVGRRRRLKNLAQLDASIPVCVTRSERLRWWRAYAAALGAGDSTRAMSNALDRLLARKVRVVHDPLE